MNECIDIWILSENMLRGRGILVFVITELLMGNSHINYVLLGKWHKSVQKMTLLTPSDPPLTCPFYCIDFSVFKWRVSKMFAFVLWMKNVDIYFHGLSPASLLAVQLSISPCTYLMWLSCCHPLLCKIPTVG